MAIEACGFPVPFVILWILKRQKLLVFLWVEKAASRQEQTSRGTLCCFADMHSGLFCVFALRCQWNCRSTTFHVELSVQAKKRSRHSWMRFGQNYRAGKRTKRRLIVRQISSRIPMPFSRLLCFVLKTPVPLYWHALSAAASEYPTYHAHLAPACKNGWLMPFAETTSTPQVK